jgi:DNA recombination protein RmuC
MAVTITIAASLVVAVLAFLLGRSVGLARGRANTEQELRSVREELNDAQRRLAVSESRNVAYGEAEKIFKDTFTALAGSALNQNSEQFLKRAEERFKNLQADTTTELDKRKVAIENLIAPLDQSLKSLDSKVAELEAKRIEAYTEVRTQISELGNVNKELRNQTGSLVQALRSPNVRGSWGQMQLRRAVEMAGMLGHCDFFEQISEATDSGRLTPDMIVTLPGDRRVVVDAKAPRMYLEALADRSDAERSLYLKDHAAKVRAHMTLLSGKKYWEQFTPTPEFVVMFLPVEALFAAALQEDPELLEYAVDRKVIPASPLTLIALLRAVNYGWKQESLAQDAEKIRELGKDLYHAVRVLAGHLSKMRNNLEDTVENFNASVGSVERSFLSKARKLAELNAAGDEPIQLLEPIDERLRGLEAVELRADLSDTPMLEGLILEPTDQEP